MCFCSVAYAEELNTIPILLEKSDAADLAIKILNEKVNLFEKENYVCVLEYRPYKQTIYDVNKSVHVEFVRNLYLNTICIDSNLLTEAYVIESINPFFKEHFIVIKRST
jgi:hypothetical protein